MHSGWSVPRAAPGRHGRAQEACNTLTEYFSAPQHLTVSIRARDGADAVHECIRMHTHKCYRAEQSCNTCADGRTCSTALLMWGTSLHGCRTCCSLATHNTPCEWPARQLHTRMVPMILGPMADALIRQPQKCRQQPLLLRGRNYMHARTGGKKGAHNHGQAARLHTSLGGQLCCAAAGRTEATLTNMREVRVPH